jgi:hypothetical protein
MKNTKNATKNAVETKKEEVNLIDALLKVIDAVDTKAIDNASKETDTELLRSNLAKLVIDTAHKLNELKSVSSVSTMREMLYNLIAIETKKSIAFHAENEAKAKDTISDIKSSDNAVKLFSTMYKKEYAKR